MRRFFLVEIAFRLAILLAGMAVADAGARASEPSLLAAAREGDLPAVRELIREGANVNELNPGGQSALMLATWQGDFEMARALLWAGADPSLRDVRGRRAMDMAPPDTADSVALQLLLRCWTYFGTRHAAEQAAPLRPHLVVINDKYVDPMHPEFAGRYWINADEAEGAPGRDDDRNGFVDDVYGWNFDDHEPLRAPLLAIDESEETKRFLEDLAKSYAGLGQRQPNEAAALRNRLRRRYDNPLVKQIGLEALWDAGIPLDDYRYAKLFYSASHGTHVAGVALEASGGEALIHATSTGAMKTKEAALLTRKEFLEGKAREAASYLLFLEQVAAAIRDESRRTAERAGDYLEHTGAGVVNLSWLRNAGWVKRRAEELEKIYRETGSNPDSIAGVEALLTRDRLSEVALELAIADAALFAQLAHEHPNVLFVVAAGNHGEDVDKTFPSPAWLSALFPNVVTVGACDEVGAPLPASNYGELGVQLFAPGKEVHSAMLGGIRGSMSGTSMAAPQVAGVAARIREKFPTLTAPDVREVLEASAARSERLEGKCSSGGILDPLEAARLAEDLSRHKREDSRG